MDQEKATKTVLQLEQDGDHIGTIHTESTIMKGCFNKEDLEAIIFLMDKKERDEKSKTVLYALSENAKWKYRIELGFEGFDLSAPDKKTLYTNIKESFKDSHGIDLNDNEITLIEQVHSGELQPKH